MKYHQDLERALLMFFHPDLWREDIPILERLAARDRATNFALKVLNPSVLAQWQASLERQMKVRATSSQQ